MPACPPLSDTLAGLIRRKHVSRRQTSKSYSLRQRLVGDRRNGLALVSEPLKVDCSSARRTYGEGPLQTAANLSWEIADERIPPSHRLGLKSFLYKSADSFGRADQNLAQRLPIAGSGSISGQPSSAVAPYSSRSSASSSASNDS